MASCQSAEARRCEPERQQGKKIKDTQGPVMKQMKHNFSEMTSLHVTCCISKLFLSMAANGHLMDYE